VPIVVKVIFTIAALGMLPFVLWSIRPSQKRAVSSSWFRLGSNDPFYHVLFQPDGTPKKHSWLFPLVLFAVFTGIVWLAPTS
jgi:hypothetical protein